MKKFKVTLVYTEFDTYQIRESSFIVYAEDEEDAARIVRGCKYLETCDIDSIVEVPEDS